MTTNWPCTGNIKLFRLYKHASSRFVLTLIFIRELGTVRLQSSNLVFESWNRQLKFSWLLQLTDL